MRGALVGLLVGLFVLAGVFAVSLRCLPHRISFPPQPWPWYCSDPALAAIEALAFPVNLLTNDLSKVVPLAPLSLVTYGILGALIGSGLERIRALSPGG